MSTSVTAPLSDIVFNDIQVSGLTCFPRERWREAILYYLFGVWADKEHVIYRPKIAFGLVTLRLDTKAGGYYAYGQPEEKLPHPLPFRKEEKLVVRFEQAAVEVGLIRFVKNDRIKLLTIVLPNFGQLALWKKERRGQYGVTALGIPSHMGAISEAVRPGR